MKLFLFNVYLISLGELGNIMNCEKCNNKMHVTNSRKCIGSTGRGDIPQRVKYLFKELIYRSWKCEKCQTSIKTIEARVDEIFDMEKNAQLEILNRAIKLI